MGRKPPNRRRGAHREMSPRASEFVAETAFTDRRRRFEERLEAVRGARQRRRRQRLAWMTATWLVVTSVVVVSGGAMLGSFGVVLAVTAVAAVGVSIPVLRRAAHRRGAAAWDWRAQRYRLIGRPADEVRARSRGRVAERLASRPR